MPKEVGRARILILVTSGKHNDEIVDILGVRDTVMEVKKRYTQGSVDKAIHDASLLGRPRKYGDIIMAEVSTLAYTTSHDRRER